MPPDTDGTLRPSHVVTLDVGGHIYTTTIGTLTNGRSAMLTAMFGSDLPLARTADDRIFIDRNGKHFGAVLSFLRAGTCLELPTSGKDLAILLEEAEFYQVGGLKDAIRDCPALALYEAAAAALAAIDGPAVRYAAKLLMKTAYHAPADVKEPLGMQRPDRHDKSTYYDVEDLVKPDGAPHNNVTVEVYHDQQHPDFSIPAFYGDMPPGKSEGSMDHIFPGSARPWAPNPPAPPIGAERLHAAMHNLSFQSGQQGQCQTLGFPRAWEAIIIRKVEADSAASAFRAAGSVNSVAWCPPRSTPCSAQALISAPAVIAFLLTSVMGVAHASWKQRRERRRGLVTVYTLRLEEPAGTNTPVSEGLTMPL